MNKKVKKCLLKSGIVCGIATIGLGFGTLVWTIKNGVEKIGIAGSIAAIFGSYALFTQVGPLIYEVSKDYHDDVAWEITKEKREKKEKKLLDKQQLL